MAETQQQGQAQVTSKPEAENAAISLHSRLPAFWREDVALWFGQVESVIASAKLSDEQKYHLVVSVLDRADLKQISDILRRPPEAGSKYITLKKRLISVYEESETSQLQKLLSGLELGDMKPTQLLRKMRDLGESMIPDDALKVLWMNQLPQQIRAVLAVSSESSLDVLATMADKMWEQIEHRFVAAVSPPRAPASSQLDALTKQVEQLTLEIAELRGRSARNYRRPFHRRGRSRSHSRNRPHDSRSRNYSPTRKHRTPDNPDWECRFHYRYGDKSTRCESPCARKRQEN